MISKSFSHLLPLVAAFTTLMLGAGSAPAAWTAYNDVVWTNTELAANITTSSPVTLASCYLRNYTNAGSTLPAQATWVVSNATCARYFVSFSVPPVGSDAYTVFYGKVTLTNDYVQLNGSLTSLRFTGLDAARRYSFALFSTRGTNGASYTGRLTDVTINGADAFTNNSSTGVIRLTRAAPNDTARIAADNLDGKLIRFDGINPGVDGAFSLTMTTAVNNAYINAFMLQEFDVPSTVPEIVNGPAMIMSYTSAVLSASLTTTGALPTQVWAFWGAGVDGGTDKVAWANSMALGYAPAGAVNAAISGLAMSTTYSYRFYASNALGGAWAASSGSFTTFAMSQPNVPDVSSIAEDDPEIQWLLAHVPGFRVLSLPSAGAVTLDADAGYTIEDLRGLSFDNDPPYTATNNIWDGNTPAGYATGDGPYVCSNLAPFRLNYFTNEWCYDGSEYGIDFPQGEVAEYAIRHGFRVALTHFRDRPGITVPRGTQRLQWGSWNAWADDYMAANGMPDYRWDMLYDWSTATNADGSLTHDVLNDFVNGLNGAGSPVPPPATWIPVEDQCMMLDQEYMVFDGWDYDGAANSHAWTAVFCPSMLRVSDWYPKAGTAQEQADFEYRYYRGAALAFKIQAEAAKVKGWKNVGVYGEPHDTDTWKLWYSYNGGTLWDDVMTHGLPDPATCWHWNTWGREIAEAQGVLYPNFYLAYAGVNSVGYSVARYDYNHVLVRTIPGGRPIRPYFWPQLLGSTQRTWWNGMAPPIEDHRAITALAHFSGMNGIVVWEWAGTKIHEVPSPWVDGWFYLGGEMTVPGGTGNDVAVSTPFTAFAIGTNVTTMTQFRRYDILSISSTNGLGLGLIEFQHHPFNLFSQPGGPGTEPDGNFSLPVAEGRPTYRISRAKYASIAMPKTACLQGFFEGLALVKPVERLLSQGQPMIDSYGIYQFMEWKPTVRRVRTDKYDIIATHDPGVIRQRAPQPVVLTDFDGHAGLTLTIPADEQTRIFVVRRNTRTTAATACDGTNDADEVSNGTVTLTGTTLAAGGGNTTALRFPGVAVPVGAQVKSAVLTVTSASLYTNMTTLTVTGEAADNAAPLTMAAGDISARSRTVQSVSWPTGAWGADQVVDSSNLAAVVQEVVSRDGWASGNALTLLLTGPDGRSLSAYESGAARAATLTIEFVPAPQITAGVPAGAGSNSVTATGKLVATNGLSTSVTVYWGVRDGGVTKDFWEHSVALGSLPEGGIQTLLDGLLPSTQYYYRYYASNAMADAWSKTVCTVTRGASGGVALDVPVRSGSDDGEEYPNGTLSLASGDLELTYDVDLAAYQTVGIRFDPVTIPQGATVTAAWIQFTARSTSAGGQPPVQIGCQATDSAPVLSTNAYNISARVKTSATVPWSMPAWTLVNEAGPAQQTPDLKEVVQEVINRSGWSSGNALAFVITGGASHGAYSKDSNSGNTPPVLHLEWAGGRRELPFVATVAEDVEEYIGGTMSRDDADIELVHDATQAAPRPCDQVVGLRFTDVAIPRRAQIQAARLYFTASEAGTGTVSLAINGFAADDASAFLTNAFNVSSRLRTTASVAWSPAAWSAANEAGAAEQSPDLKNIVQEIVNRQGWDQNHALGFVISGTGRRNAWSLEGDAAKAAMLYVDWIEPLNAPVDADGDGMADDWETANLGGTTALPGVDADGDGVSNLGEYLGGTSPANSNDMFEVYLLRTNGTVVVRYPTAAAIGSGYDGRDRFYTLQKALDLKQSRWTPVYGETDIYGDGTTGAYTNNVSDPNAFYRVKVSIE